MSVPLRSAARKGHRTCRLLVRSHVDTAAYRSRSTRPPPPLATTVPVASGPAIWTATSPATGRPAAPAEHWTGGIVTPSPIQLTINPSAPPLGNTVPTGILVMNKEMILFFWGEVERPYLGTDWRDRDTGRITEEIPVPPVEMSLPIGTAGVDPIFGLQQLVVGDGTLVEYGAVRGPAARIVVRNPEGGEVEAAFTP